MGLWGGGVGAENVARIGPPHADPDVLGLYITENVGIAVARLEDPDVLGSPGVLEVARGAARYGPGVGLPAPDVRHKPVRFPSFHGRARARTFGS
jgi:hypothetical protein